MDEIRISYQWDRSEYLHVMRRAALPWIFRRKYLLGIFIFVCGVADNVWGGAAEAPGSFTFLEPPTAAIST